MVWIGKPFLSKQWASYQLTGEFPQALLISDPAFMDKQFVGSACQGSAERVQLFLQAGYPVESQGEDGLRPLHCAAATGNAELASTLLERGADVRAPYGEEQLQPIHLAASYHHLDLVRFLIEKGADVNAPSRRGSPLVLALSQREGDRPQPTELKMRLGFGDQQMKKLVPDAFEQLVALGAKLDLKDAEGNTLLHAAARMRDWAVMDELLEHGLDLNARNARGETPFLLTVRYAHYEGIGSKTYVMDRERYEQLIARGADVNARESSGHSAALYAIVDADLYDLLLAHGLDTAVATSSGVSIWYELSHARIVERVIGFADKVPEIRMPKMLDGRNGSGPLLVYARACMPDLIEYFLKRGADPREVDAWNQAPLAAANGASCHQAGDPVLAAAQKQRMVDLLNAALARLPPVTAAAELPAATAR